MTGLMGVGLFSGIGGIELAMHRNGIRTVAMCEIDKAATRVLNHRFPGVPVFDDVRKVTGDALRDLGAVPERTILTGGYPCTDLSVAGRRAGMDRGTRSGLFWEIIRILGEFPAAWVVLENVPGLLSATCPCQGDGLCVDRGLAVRCPGTLHAVPGGACGGDGCIAIHGGPWVPASGRWETAAMGSPTECWTLSTPEFRSAGVVSSSLADVLEEPGQPHLQKYSLSPKAASGILRRASRRGRSLPPELQEALEDLAASTEQGGVSSPQ